MNDRREDEKAIDYVRRKVDESRKYCETEKQLQGVDTILKALSRDDYVFIDLTLTNASKILQLAGLDLQDSVDLYKEMVNPEETRKYREFKAKKRALRQKEIVADVFKHCAPFLDKIKGIMKKESQNHEQ